MGTELCTGNTDRTSPIGKLEILIQRLCLDYFANDKSHYHLAVQDSPRKNTGYDAASAD